MIKSAVEALKQVGSSFKLEPFATIIQSIIEDVLAEHKKDKYRKGTSASPAIARAKRVFPVPGDPIEEPL